MGHNPASDGTAAVSVVRLKQQDTCPILTASFIEKKPTLTCAAAAALIQASARKHPPALYPELRTYLDAIIATTSDLAELEQL